MQEQPFVRFSLLKLVVCSRCYEGLMGKERDVECAQRQRSWSACTHHSFSPKSSISLLNPYTVSNTAKHHYLFKLDLSSDIQCATYYIHEDLKGNSTSFTHQDQFTHHREDFSACEKGSLAVSPLAEFSGSLGKDKCKIQCFWSSTSALKPHLYEWQN